MDQEETHHVGAESQIRIVHKGEKTSVPQQYVKTHGKETIDQHLIHKTDIESIGHNKRKQGNAGNQNEKGHDPERVRRFLLDAMVKCSIIHLTQTFLLQGVRAA
jgi:hypothetical protein